MLKNFSFYILGKRTKNPIQKNQNNIKSKILKTKNNYSLINKLKNTFEYSLQQNVFNPFMFIHSLRVVLTNSINEAVFMPLNFINKFLSLAAQHIANIH